MRVPFTNIEFSATKVILSYLALFGNVHANNNNNNENCLVPQGDFLDSCTMPKITFYPSSDPLVPGTCKLKTTCNTYYESMAPVKGNYYLPMATQFTGVTNKNGTLYENGSVLGKSTKSRTKPPKTETGFALDTLEDDNLLTRLFDEEECHKPAGSYEKTCEVTVAPYVSSDPELKESPFCIAKTECKTLEGEKSSSLVYFNLQENKKFENCGGTVLSRRKDQRDNLCDYPATEKEIKAIVASELYGKVSRP